jgi:hypothetical protein
VAKHRREVSATDADPLRCLLRLDEETETTMSSFSEFAAYLALLRQFHDGKKLASYLSIPLTVLRRRMAGARERANDKQRCSTASRLSMLTSSPRIVA